MLAMADIVDYRMLQIYAGGIFPALSNYQVWQSHPVLLLTSQGLIAEIKEVVRKS